MNSPRTREVPPFYMEENLETPIRKLLKVMQDRIVHESTYFGVKTVKCPLDYWVYQELIVRLKPDVILEIGNFKGGSTLALAHLCDLCGKGRVIGVDLTHLEVAEVVRRHPRITLIEGDACRSFDRVREQIRADENVLIIEDSSHTYEDTLHLLKTYASLLRPGDYFIVEDGIAQHGLDESTDRGPTEAVETFVNENPDFMIERERESFGITWNPKGYVRRIGSEAGVTAPEARSAVTAASLKRTAKLFIPPILLKLYRALKG